MDLDPTSESVTRLADRAPPPAVVARVGLGAMILLAGVHKLLAPGAWALYLTDWLAPWLVVSPVTFMLVNGVLEVVFERLDESTSIDV